MSGAAEQARSPLPALALRNQPSEIILKRLQSLYPVLIDLSLTRICRLLAALEHPEQRLPPVIHVAGTNGKGSTCAFLRAIAEASGLRVHVATSPHLVRLNERFRVAGKLVEDDALEAVLLDIERVNAGAPITVFEVLVAASYVLFAGTPADLCIVEVGLGGRFDATNVIAAPVSCAIASISMDHQEFLGNRLDQIAAEKAGIIKPGRPVVSAAQPASVAAVLQAEASRIGSPIHLRGQSWDVSVAPFGIRYTDDRGGIDLPLPGLVGHHQVDNAGLAVAALRVSGLPISDTAYAGVENAQWPARLQWLHGRLARLLSPSFELWLDGGHNEGAGLALAVQLDAWADRPVYLVVGMKQSKDVAAFLAPLVGRASRIWAVREPNQHLGLPIEDVIAASGGVALPGPDIVGALAQIGQQVPGQVLICGSLYLAGEALRADGSLPT